MEDPVNYLEFKALLELLESHVDFFIYYVTEKEKIENVEITMDHFSSKQELELMGRFVKLLFSCNSIIISNSNDIGICSQYQKFIDIMKKIPERIMTNFAGKGFIEQHELLLKEFKSKLVCSN